MAPKVKRAVTTNFAAFHGLLDIIELKPHKRRLVERNLRHTDKYKLYFTFRLRKK
jgi:hypothetical protein